MEPARLDLLAQTLQKKNLEAALLSNPATITWLTGYAPPIQTGPSPFEGGPAVLWWAHGEVALVVSDMESVAANATGLPVLDYLSYTIEAPLAGSVHQGQALAKALQANPAGGAVGVEFSTLPASLQLVLQETCPEASLRPLDGTFDRLRAVKFTDEIEKIRQALKLCDLAQEEARARLRVGSSEIELWTNIKSRMEREAGGRLPVLADLVGGLRTAEIGGLPGGYLLQPGDPLIVDVVPRLDGYWGDNAATWFVGEPSAELGRIYRVVRDTLLWGVEAVRPGMVAADLDHQLRECIRRSGYDPYPHHSGHGIGAAYHEEPRIVPYNTLVLEPGMVIALEPGIYVPGVGGIRLEDVVLVTSDGCEVLTSHLLE